MLSERHTSLLQQKIIVPQNIFTEYSVYVMKRFCH
jgi:hypothetical protein